MESDNTNTSVESPLIIGVVDDNEKSSTTTNNSHNKLPIVRKQLTPKEKNYIHKFIDSLKNEKK
jgi:hypothetical protein